MAWLWPLPLALIVRFFGIHRINTGAAKGPIDHGDASGTDSQ